MKVGLELEFNCIDEKYFEFMELLKSHNFDFIFSPRQNFSNDKDLVIKPECSVSGLELNIPPNYDKLKELLDLTKQYVYFSNRCAMHIHISDEKINQHNLKEIYEQYSKKENLIINEVKNKKLYLNLNDKNSSKNFENNKSIRKINLNVWSSYIEHKTIEHRIYKSTFDYNEIMWCINQTKNIIEEILENYEFKETKYN